MTQEDLAKAIGVDQSAVSLWEKGIGPKRDRLLEIAKILDCNVGDLLYVAEDVDQNNNGTEAIN